MDTDITARVPTETVPLFLPPVINVPVLHIYASIGAGQASTIVTTRYPAQSKLTTTMEENDNSSTSLPSSARKKRQSCEFSNITQFDVLS